MRCVVRYLFLAFFVIVLGRMPSAMWNALGKDCKKNVLTAYAQEYLQSREYCAAVKILIKETNGAVYFGAECTELKM